MRIIKIGTAVAAKMRRRMAGIIWIFNRGRVIVVVKLAHPERHQAQTIPLRHRAQRSGVVRGFVVPWSGTIIFFS